MRGLRNAPIQRKLRFVVMMTCSAALFAACASLFGLQYFSFRRDFAQDLAATAELAGGASAAAIRARDRVAGEQVLSGLKSKPHLTAAALYLRDGTRLASFGDTRGFSPDGKMPETGLTHDATDALYTHSIFTGTDFVGTLYLRADLESSLAQLVQLYAGILIFVNATAYLAARIISARLEPLILDPLAHLARAARKVAADNDYSVRAEKLVEDELGSFTDSFNSMLDEIHARDQALLHEIAERKRAERELHEMHLRLVDTSRRAGMAEVATGVLHNVGNVLNSVNVSATLIAERLDRSRSQRLVEATALLRGRNGQLATFLEHDPKGRILPTYLAELSEHLDSERQGALAELELLTRNVGHIKDIVAMQQSHARVSGLAEIVAVEALIEDALRLDVGSFDRPAVNLVRRYEPVPPVALDRHMVLQILVNLFRNARQAMDDVDLPARRLTIGLRCVDGCEIEIAVADTGVGIAAEHLTKVFAHGFSTRSDGHGFGLHTAALAAEEMGGRLAASSPGPGRGAVFTLTLPIPAASPTA